MLAECGACGALYAPDLLACPQCGSEERADEMPKIITGTGPTFPEGHGPDDSFRPDDPDAGEAPETLAEAEAEVAEAASDLAAAEAAPAPAPVPPRLPPRRLPPPVPHE